MIIFALKIILFLFILSKTYNELSVKINYPLSGEHKFLKKREAILKAILNHLLKT